LLQIVVRIFFHFQCLFLFLWKHVYMQAKVAWKFFGSDSFVQKIVKLCLPSLLRATSSCQQVGTSSCTWLARHLRWPIRQRDLQSTICFRLVEIKKHAPPKRARRWRKLEWRCRQSGDFSAERVCGSPSFWVPPLGRRWGRGRGWKGQAAGCRSMASHLCEDLHKREGGINQLVLSC